MTRSFVRDWATVATLLAMVCFAFIQPMPVDTGFEVASDSTMAWVPAGGHLDESPPLIDSVLSGKTFSPIVAMSAPPRFVPDEPRGFRPSAIRESLPNPPVEPLIRPG